MKYQKRFENKSAGINQLTDLTIEKAWKSIQVEPPCSVETFLSELSSYKNFFAFELIDIRE